MEEYVVEEAASGGLTRGSVEFIVSDKESVQMVYPLFQLSLP